jgi:hypothetical protein
VRQFKMAYRTEMPPLPTCAATLDTMGAMASYASLAPPGIIDGPAQLQTDPRKTNV